MAQSNTKKKYDVIVIGGGGHGLATAYYLAKEFGVTNVAVVEKGYLGGGNTGRNTTIVGRTIYGMRRPIFTSTLWSVGRSVTRP